MERKPENKVRVLVVDDEELLADTLVDRLANWGYVGTAAYNGYDGLRLFEQGDFQIVLLDLKMPDLDGITVFKRIKALNPGVPVIMISGYGSTETAGEAMREGMYDFMAKPVDNDALKMIIERALGVRGREGERVSVHRL